CVFLNTGKSSERRRFDAAHELGHLVVHKHAAPGGIAAVSVAAMAHRLHQLGIMSKWTYQTLYTEISRRGYRTKEPFSARMETSQVWQKVFAELRKDGLGLACHLRMTMATAF